MFLFLELAINICFDVLFKSFHIIIHSVTGGVAVILRYTPSERFCWIAVLMQKKRLIVTAKQTKSSVTFSHSVLLFSFSISTRPVTETNLILNLPLCVHRESI